MRRRLLPIVLVLAGWSWEHPTPHDGTVTAMVTRGRDAYTVGPRGALFVLRDSASWQPLASATQQDLRAIAAGTSIVAVGARGAIVRSRDGVTFEARASQTTAELVSVAIDGDFVIAIGSEGAVVRSLDGGDTFAALPGIQDITHAVAIARSGVYVAAFGGIYRSTDRGATWKRVIAVEATQALAVDDKGTVYAVGGSNVTYPSTHVCGSCIDATYETIALYRSADGVTWRRRTLEDPTTNDRAWGAPKPPAPPQQPPPGGRFSHRGVGAPLARPPWGPRTIAIAGDAIRVGDRDSEYASKDRGATFTKSNRRARGVAVRRVVSENLFAIAASPNGRVFAAGLGGALLARGSTGEWTKLAVPTSREQRLEAIHAADSHVVVVGEGGVILKSTDGTTFQHRASDKTDDLTAVWGIGDDVYAAGRRTFLRSKDRGRSWESVDAPFSPVGAIWGTRNELYVLAGDVYRSTDRGATWTKSSPNAHYTALWGNGNALFLAGADGKLARSTDHGATWQSIATGTTDDLRAMWGRGKDLVVVGETVLRSRDGGSTWRSEPTPTQHELFAITGTAKHVWALGESATILRGTP